MKKILLTSIVLGMTLTMSIAFAEECPNNTQAFQNRANLVGEITSDGGDSNLQVWFEYGENENYGSATSSQEHDGEGLFCKEVNDLNSCTSYHYRAVGENSAGEAYGGNKSFTTTCPVSVDLKADDSNGPIEVPYLSNIELSWSSEYASSCQASGDWSGSKAIQGHQTRQMNQVKTYNFEIECEDAGENVNQTDSVEVIVNAGLPTVVTMPAVVTY